MAKPWNVGRVHPGGKLALLMNKVSPEPNSGCWLWTGYLNKGGYGGFKLPSRMHLAHRVAYELLREPIPAGLDLDHLCRVRSCVNPWHLEPVDRKENVRRGIGVGLKGGLASQARAALITHCPSMHPYDEANTFIDTKGWRRCRECNRARARKLNGST